jgi:hypothetical protein
VGGDTGANGYEARMKQREIRLDEEEFKQLLTAKSIRPASLEDVMGTHHKRPLVRHPRTGQWFVLTKESIAILRRS